MIKLIKLLREIKIIKTKIFAKYIDLSRDPNTNVEAEILVKIKNSEYEGYIFRDSPYNIDLNNVYFEEIYLEDDIIQYLKSSNIPYNLNKINDAYGGTLSIPIIYFDFINKKLDEIGISKNKIEAKINKTEYEGIEDIIFKIEGQPYNGVISSHDKEIEIIDTVSKIEFLKSYLEDGNMLYQNIDKNEIRIPLLYFNIINNG